MATNTTSEMPHKAANSAKETDSIAPLVDNEAEQAGQADEPHRHKNWFKRLSRSGKGNKHEGEGEDKSKRKSSISDSGPYIFAFDPKLGKEVLVRNPHWPNEDSWKREKETEGQWAFGSMGGQQAVDFGGTTG